MGSVISPMSASVAARLCAAPFTYSEVGATADSGLPTGYHHLDRARALPAGSFDEAAARLMSWKIHEAAGLRVSASSTRVEPDSVVQMFVGPRWLNIRAVCRVVYVIDEPDRAGFGYGTLPGHAESGEESFVIERRGDGVRFVVRAFSKPTSRLARIGGPATSAVQRLMTERYLRSAAPGR